MSVRILQGDCREVLKSLPDESVHCVVTSPPYFGLRDYGTAKWDGGDPDCDHATFRSTSASTLKNDGRPNPGACEYDKSVIVPYRSKCGKCGAHRIDSQIGLEPTPDAYVAEMVSVFRELRRVLRCDGVAWLYLGDSYAGYHGNKNSEVPTSATNGWTNGTNENARTSTANRNGIKPKDLIGIPWRVAFALQSDGWWLRQDIIWAKPNPMPESVTDRCTKAHEYLFLLTKSARYYFDAEAIKTDSDRAGEIAGTGPKSLSRGQSRGANVNPSGNAKEGGFCISPERSNKRSVWTIATQAFSQAHFATFPPALIEPCILAGCPEKCCAKCRAPWVRVVDEGDSVGRRDSGGQSGGVDLGMSRGRAGSRERATLGFSSSCSCNAASVPGTCLDPFGGAGTTGLVADRLQRNAILIELNPAYAEMAERRIHNDAPLLMEAAE